MTRTKVTVKRQQRKIRERQAQRVQFREATEAEQQQQAQGEEKDATAPLIHEEQAEREEAGIEGKQKTALAEQPVQVQEARDEEEGEQEDEDEDEEEEEDDDENSEGQLLLTDYEKQRERRLKENAAKIAALNLPALASSFGPPIRQQQRQSSKKKSKLDDDYMPSSGSQSEESAADDSNEDGSGPCDQQDVDCNYNEEQALKEAIALSLTATAENGAGTRSRASRTCKGKRQVSDKNDVAKKRRKGRQEQVTHDEVAAIFSLIDERGSGKFSVTELERIARSHDFTWSNQEISDMIDFFDTNKDGQLDLSEFQDIFERMNMLKMHVA